MKPFESIIEKEYNCRIMPYKPKPLCSCFVGDKMVDMYAKFNFDVKKIGWGRAYKGHTHSREFNDWLDNIEVYDETDEELNKTINALDDYFRLHQLYLH